MSRWYLQLYTVVIGYRGSEPKVFPIYPSMGVCVYMCLYNMKFWLHTKNYYIIIHPIVGKTVNWTEVYLLIHERYVLFSSNRNISGWSQPSAILYNSVMVCLQLAGVGYMVLKIVGGGQQKWL